MAEFLNRKTILEHGNEAGWFSAEVLDTSLREAYGAQLKGLWFMAPPGSTGRRDGAINLLWVRDSLLPSPAPVKNPGELLKEALVESCAAALFTLFAAKQGGYVEPRDLLGPNQHY